MTLKTNRRTLLRGFGLATAAGGIATLAGGLVKPAMARQGGRSGVNTHVKVTILGGGTHLYPFNSMSEGWVGTGGIQFSQSCKPPTDQTPCCGGGDNGGDDGMFWDAGNAPSFDDIVFGFWDLSGDSGWNNSGFDASSAQGYNPDEVLTTIKDGILTTASAAVALDGGGKIGWSLFGGQLIQDYQDITPIANTLGALGNDGLPWEVTSFGYNPLGWYGQPLLVSLVQHPD